MSYAISVPGDGIHRLACRCSDYALATLCLLLAIVRYVTMRFIVVLRGPSSFNHLVACSIVRTLRT